jgi:predicted DNA-binding protein with PD1-like motif
VGWFDRAAKQYRRIPVDEQCEVLSLIGDVARALIDLDRSES